MDILEFKGEYFKNLENNRKVLFIDNNYILNNDDKKQNQADNDGKQNQSDNNETSINELIEIISDKINSAETINELLIDDLYLKLKNLCGEHNKKINDWYDSKYYDDLNILKNNFKEYNIFNNLCLTKSFVIIEDEENEINNII